MIPGVASDIARALDGEVTSATSATLAKIRVAVFMVPS
jgi:hypothetical protein